MIKIPELIIKKFEDFADYKCWAFCSKDKIPCQVEFPSRNLQWKEHPELGLTTLDELIEYSPDHYGFGIFTGLYDKYRLGCFDFDNFLWNGKPDYNNLIDKFLYMGKTFAEYSSSRNGIHSFYKLSPSLEVKEFDIDIEKFGIKLTDDEKRILSLREEEKNRLGVFKKIPGGRFYCNMHFIKLTGEPYIGDNYNAENYDIINLHKDDYQVAIDKVAIKKEIPVFTTIKPTIQTSFQKTWYEILTEVGIQPLPAKNYIGERNGKVVVECLKIPCPNRHNHQTKRRGDITSDLAILSRYDDGTSSCKCLHHSCAPSTRPNLLKKLWDEIRQKNIEISQSNIKIGNKILDKINKENENDKKAILEGKEILKRLNL